MQDSQEQDTNKSLLRSDARQQTIPRGDAPHSDIATSIPEVSQYAVYDGKVGPRHVYVGKKADVRYWTWTLEMVNWGVLS